MKITQVRIEEVPRRLFGIDAPVDQLSSDRLMQAQSLLNGADPRRINLADNPFRTVVHTT